MNPETKAALAALQNYHFVYVLLAIFFLIAGTLLFRAARRKTSNDSRGVQFFVSVCFVVCGVGLLMYFLGGALVPERLLVIQRIP